MKTSLIHCPWGINKIPYALACMSAYLRSRNHETQVFDFNLLYIQSNYSRTDSNKNAINFFKLWMMRFGGKPFKIDRSMEKFLDACAEKLVNSGTDVVAFSITQPNSKNSVALADKIKRRDRRTTVIFGGPDCSRTANGYEYIKLDCVDYVVVGEGEKAMNNILNDIERGTKKDYYRGALSKKNTRIIDGGDEEPLDMNSLPYPDFSNFDLSTHPVIPVEMSRGCTGQCAFCGERDFWRRFRSKKGKRMGMEIQHLVKRYHIKNFSFMDSAINNNINELNGFCDYIIKNRIKIQWGCQARIFGMNRELLKKMKRAGCVCIFFGIESGSQRVLDSMKKGFVLSDAEEIIKYTNRTAIDVKTGYLTGFPTETPLDFLRTIRFIHKTKKHVKEFIISIPCILIRGSDIYENYKKYGIVNRNRLLWRTSFYTNTIIDRAFKFLFLKIFSRL
jgi:anaerobic magnesium-protoporphyrin IX monomethyl ester cyclase